MLLALHQRQIDMERGIVRYPEDPHTLRLSRRELSLLRFMVERPNVDLSRETLQQEVWGYSSEALTRAVDATVVRLRRKIEPRPAEPEFVLTVHGHGYRFVPPHSAHAEPLAHDFEGVAAPRRGALVSEDVEIDLDRGVVLRDHVVVQRLTAQEIQVLLRLRAEPGRTVARGQLMRLGPNFRLTAQGLSNTMHRLRRKLPPHTLETVRGVGYRLHAVAKDEQGSFSEVLWALARGAAELLDLDDCVVYRREGNTLVQAAAHGPKNPGGCDIVNPLRIAIGQGIVGSVAQRNQAEAVADTAADPRYIHDVGSGRSEVCVPVTRRGEVVAIIDSEAPSVGAYGSSQLCKLQALGRIASVAADALKSD